MPLGEYCVLGGGFFDRGNCVHVAIAPTSSASVHGLMPGQPMHESIMHLLRIYLGYEAQAVITMKVAPELMPAPMLEPNAISLGYTTLLPRNDATALSHRASIRIRLGTWNRPDGTMLS